MYTQIHTWKVGLSARAIFGIAYRRQCTGGGSEGGRGETLEWGGGGGGNPSTLGHRCKKRKKKNDTYT